MSSGWRPCKGRPRGAATAPGAWAGILVLHWPHSSSLPRVLPLTWLACPIPQGRVSRQTPRVRPLAAPNLHSPKVPEGLHPSTPSPRTNVDTPPSWRRHAFIRESLTWRGARAPVTALGPHGPTQLYSAFRVFTQPGRGAQKSWVNHLHPFHSSFLWVSQVGTSKGIPLRGVWRSWSAP